MFVFVFIQQILNRSQAAPLLSKAELRSPSGLALTTPSGLTSSQTTLQRSKRERLHRQTGPGQQRARYPLSDGAPLLPSTFRYLLLRLRRTWRQQRPWTPLLQAAKRRSLPCHRGTTPCLNRCNQKPRRRRNLGRKSPRIALSQQVQLRGVKEARTQSWSVLNIFL